MSVPSPADAKPLKIVHRRALPSAAYAKRLLRLALQMSEDDRRLIMVSAEQLVAARKRRPSLAIALSLARTP
jgi:hypothetical protein